jgi:poly(A) polymerase
MRWALMVAMWVMAGGLSSGAAEEPRELVVVSWNVLADAGERARRLPALLSILRDAHADVIAVQEATTWVSTALAAEAWARDLRRVPTGADQPFPGGLALFTRLPLVRAQVVELSTGMGRCGLLIDLAFAQTEICFGVVHLDGHLEDGPMRARQLRTMVQAMAAKPHAVMLGDFNCGDGEAELREVPPAFVDAWSPLHPGEPGFTWDVARSPMARRGSFPGEPSRRLDRVLVRSPHWRPAAMSLLGTEAVPDTGGEVFPSDHFGVRVVLRVP